MGEHTAYGNGGMYVTLRMQKTKDLVNNPISDEAMELIGPRGTGKVFIGFEDYMTQAPMRRWLKAAGITKHISFHCTRHTFGILQVEAGTAVYTVQHMLGHKNVETTQIYADMSDEQKRESINRITLKISKRGETNSYIQTHTISPN